MSRKSLAYASRLSRQEINKQKAQTRNQTREILNGKKDIPHHDTAKSDHVTTK